jgi:cell wall-associated NlpC family hydrolase
MTDAGTERLLARRALLGACVMIGSMLPPGSAAAQTNQSSHHIGVLSAMSESARSLRDSIVTLTRAQIGRRYRTGGSSPERGFDCSGLIQYVMSRVELRVPRTSSEQANVGVAVDRDTSQLRPGDLLTFTARGKEQVSHIGIYVGDGRYVHASSVARRVIESPIDRPPFPKVKQWLGARRMPGLPEEAPIPADVIAAPER